METCYHCSQGIEYMAIVDAGEAIYHPGCYATSARAESCGECGGVGPNVFVANANYLLPIHGSCVMDRAARLAVR